MIGVVLAGLFTAAPPPSEVGVLVTSERRVAPDVLQAIVARVTSALVGTEKVTALSAGSTKERLVALGGLEAAKKCQGSTACVGHFAAALGPYGIVVSVDVGKLGKTLTIQLDAVTEDGSVLVSSTLTVPAQKLNAMAAPLSAFALALAQRLPVRLPEPAATAVLLVAPSPIPPDAPRAPALDPQPTDAPGVTLVDRPPRSSSKLPWVLVGGAALVIAASIVFAVLAANDRAQWDRSLLPEAQRFGSSLTASEANTLASKINTETTVSLVAGLTGGGLCVSALVAALTR